MADRPQTPGDVDFAARNGWDRAYELYDDFDLPTYVGLPSFMKLPWITDPAELRARGVDIAIVGAPFDDAVSHRPGRPVRAAGDPRGAVHDRLDPLAAAGRRAVRGPDRRRRRRRQHRPVVDRSRPRADLPQGPRGRGDRRDPDRRSAATTRSPGRPPRRSPSVRRAGQHRHRPLRRPRRHGERRLGRARGARDADAPADRVGRGQGSQLRPGRPARLLAAGRDVRLDAGAGDALAPHARDRGARRGGRGRRRDRRGARRPGRDLPLDRHRRDRPGDGARAPARPSPAAC